MKKQIGSIIAIIVAVLIVCLLVWRIWPQSSATVISISKDSIASFSVSGMFQNFETGNCDFYTINSSSPICNEPKEVMEILAASKYQQDFRNLLLWGVDGVSADKNYDGRTVTLCLYYNSEGSKYIEFQFLSKSIVVVRTAEQANMRIYHLINTTTFDKLVEYVQTNGVKQ